MKPRVLKRITCWLKINHDSSVIFIIKNKQNAFYEEDTGTISHLSDTTYLVKTKALFVQWIMETMSNKRFSEFAVHVGSNFQTYKDVEALTIKYYRGRDTTIKTQKGKTFVFPFDKTRFNWNHPTIKVITHKRNPITKELVFVELGLKASIGFSSSDEQEFKVVIVKNILKTVGESPVQCGEFTLARKNGS